MKPICVPCQRFYRCKKNDYVFIEAMQADDAIPGHWTPYKVWAGDLWECDGCKGQIVSGVAFKPLAEHYQPDFEEVLRREKPELQVNDF